MEIPMNHKVARTGAPTATAKPHTRTTAAAPDGRERISKLIRRLDSPNDNEVVAAARALISELQANGSDLHNLATAWDAEWQRLHGPQAPRQRPVDWADVEAFVTRFADGKITVMMNAALRAVHAAQPDVPRDTSTSGFVARTLIRLGFAPSRSGASFRRATTGPD
jgi:hypothetical protein